ncbi:NAD(P)H-binding protein [Candidatus Thiothrix sp. Deng01]|uniref:NAD(P)H-binding protein n=1 Tax=Candidatus Thiothrix phosphatis TaxID=3112415 RepID=A0ABU6D3E4_9GAMM|nr:NAD(P)H-binding protein [Candidatus Thiothrix sp. Deng01]MEB4593578.1 NAD(P)H-binding protein [Candidatus Thiothrix sp. Deng01]
MKTLAIIGASAGVGLECVRIALERGHQVTTLSRSVASLPAHSRLNAIQGSATKLDDLQRACAGADAVLITLGTGMDRKPTTLYTDFGQALLQIQDSLGATPIQILTGFGAGDSAAYQGVITKMLFRLLLKAVYDNKTELERMVESSRLNWSLVRPGLLTNGASDTMPRIQTTYHSGMKVGSVSRKAVARFMVEQAENPGFLHQKPALSAR